jgi:hypothetical protein
MALQVRLGRGRRPDGRRCGGGCSGGPARAGCDDRAPPHSPPPPPPVTPCCPLKRAVIARTGRTLRGDVMMCSTPSKRHANGVTAVMQQLEMAGSADAALYLHPAESGPLRPFWRPFGLIFTYVTSVLVRNIETQRTRVVRHCSLLCACFRCRWTAWPVTSQWPRSAVRSA